MGLGDFFKSKTKTRVLQTPQEKKARGFLAGLIDTPQNLPTEQIAGLSEAEQQAAETARQFGASQPGGVNTLQSFLDEDPSFSQSPSGQALIEQVTRIGQEETGRVGRSLQTRGGGSSTTGRDILGQSVQDTQRNILATLAPFEAQRASQRITAAQALQATGDSATLNRLNALSQTGAVERQLEQLQLSAEFARKSQQAMQPIQASQTLLGSPAQQAVIQSKSTFAQIAEPIAALLHGAGSIGGGGVTTTGGTGGVASNASGSSNAQMAGMLALSDERFKKNIRSIGNVRDKIKALKAYSYSFVGTDTPRIGLMAQEVEKVFPEAVLDIDGKKHVDMYAIQSLIISALSEEYSEV